MLCHQLHIHLKRTDAWRGKRLKVSWMSVDDGDLQPTPSPWKPEALLGFNWRSLWMTGFATDTLPLRSKTLLGLSMRAHRKALFTSMTGFYNRHTTIELGNMFCHRGRSRNVLNLAHTKPSTWTIFEQKPTQVPCKISSLKVSCTSSTAQGGGGSFKNRKPIGEIGCCESEMAERSHCWTERRLISLTLSLTIYLPTSLSSYVSVYLSIYLSIYLSSCLPVYLWCSVIQCNVV